MLRINISRLVGLSFLIALALGITLVRLVFFPSMMQAESSIIKVESSSIVSEFPEGFRARVAVNSSSAISSIALRVRAGQDENSAYEYMKFDPGASVNAELLWRTKTTSKYIPPGTIVTYNFEITDSSGGRLETGEQQFLYDDIRFQWQEIKSGSTTVQYYGKARAQAESILDAIVQTLARMSPVLGAESQGPIRVTVYNSVDDMVVALPPDSETIRTELVTEGQAFTNVGTLLILSDGRLIRGTASHEITHILVHRAGEGTRRDVPSWLHEGLAEYGNIEQSQSYEKALQTALQNNKLLPVMFMQSFPGDPGEIILFYGQARSIVRFMLEKFDPGKMAVLMAAVKGGKKIDDALLHAYEMDRLTLDNAWRDSIGAPHYVPPDSSQLLPTPPPVRTLQPYSLTPQPGTVTATPGSVASPTSTPSGSSTSVVLQTPTAVPGTGGAGCASAKEDTAVSFDIAFPVFLLGLLGFRLLNIYKR